MSIGFFLKDKNKERTSIDVIVRFRGQRYKIASGESVVVKFWNVAKKQCQENRQYPDGHITNLRLNKIKSILQDIFDGYQISGVIPTEKQVRTEFEQKAYDVQSPGEKTFIDFIKQHIEASKYELLTRKQFLNLIEIIEKYQGVTRKKLYPSDIDMSFYRSFQLYFEDAGYSKNYFGGIIKRIKVVLNNQTDEIGHKHKGFSAVSETADSIYLSVDELMKIFRFDVSVTNLFLFYQEMEPHKLKKKSESLELVRSRFLIGAFTGLRVSDFSRVSNINVGDQFIRIQPKKGQSIRKNSDVVIPIHPVIREILDSGFDLTKTVSDQKMNVHIKELCRLAGITETVSISRTEGGKVVSKQYEKWELVSTHTARRSAATNMFKAGIPAISIMKITGHKTENAFLKYIKVSAEENAELLSGHAFFR